MRDNIKNRQSSLKYRCAVREGGRRRSLRQVSRKKIAGSASRVEMLVAITIIHTQD